MSYIVKLDNFEGPFDLLLQLIEQKHLDITELSLSKVTGDYLEAIEHLELSIEEMNWFLYVAARLVLAKSQTVLKLQVDEDESSEDIQDLAESLKRYKELQQVTKQLRDMSKQPMFGRSLVLTQAAKLEINPVQLSITMQQLTTALKKRAQRISIQSRSVAVARIRKRFLQHIGALKSFSLQSTISSAPDRAQAVVYFVTILELIREQKIATKGESLEIVGVSV